jgi:hypothetical protein
MLYDYQCKNVNAEYDVVQMCTKRTPFQVSIDDGVGVGVHSNPSPLCILLLAGLSVMMSFFGCAFTRFACRLMRVSTKANTDQQTMIPICT